MSQLLKNLKWAASLESADGVAREVDVKEVKSHVTIDDVDPNDITDADTETQPNTDGGDEVSANTTHDIVDGLEAHAESALISGEDGGKVIEATGIDPKSNAPKRFVISGFNAQTNPAAEPGDNLLSCVILLQNGVLPEVGINGVTCEDLLKVVEETFVCFQEGQFACEENDEVLMHVRGALGAIGKRLARRESQGTEGTYQGN